MRPKIFEIVLWPITKFTKSCSAAAYNIELLGGGGAGYRCLISINFAILIGLVLRSYVTVVSFEHNHSRNGLQNYPSFIHYSSYLCKHTDSDDNEFLA